MIRALSALMLLPALASAGPLLINEDRARFDYQMNCQGCHTGDGRGGKSVPGLRGTMGLFLQSQQGREYLVRVPGSANATLSDTRLAEVLNWMLLSYADESLPRSWTPFQAEEVADYRREPLYEVIQYRQDLLARLGDSPRIEINSVEERTDHEYER